MMTQLRDVAGEHVVAHAIGLHTELELVVAAEVAVHGAVSLEVAARLLVAIGLRIRRNVREAGRVLQARPACRADRRCCRVQRNSYSGSSVTFVSCQSAM